MRSIPDHDAAAAIKVQSTNSVNENRLVKGWQEGFEAFSYPVSGYIHQEKHLRVRRSRIEHDVKQMLDWMI